MTVSANKAYYRVLQVSRLLLPLTGGASGWMYVLLARTPDLQPRHGPKLRRLAN